ncbi:nucleoporin protein Ndc1-Nup [Russula earlei]|uniref:Nucleoporin protein Ndc1-Nup n=1 Tax=Russula earlei TaxID=71964 RepID=A0ACC0UIY9_9AGAM|nr:nucleoporin protein Ndc1-Nup [Russula earlei]
MSAATLPSPVRAITSTLSARTAPPVPPASQSYEPLARAVLRRRLLYDILPLSTLPLWLSTIFWKMWNAGGIPASSVWSALLLPILPSTLVMSTLVWAFGVLPIIVLRKSQLTARPTPSSSPSQRVKVAFSKPHTLRALTLYILTSILTSASHIVSGRIFESPSHGSYHFRVFHKSRKHPYHLNGSFLFLFMAQVTLAMSFHFRSILLDRMAVRWRHGQGQSPKVDPLIGLFRRVLSISVTTSVFAAATFAAYLVAFGLMRAIALPLLFQVPLVSHILRPFFGHFVRGRWSVVLLWRNRALVWQAFLLCLTTAGGWEFAEGLFDDKVQEPLTVASHTADPLLTLISGITNSDPYYAHFSYMELRNLADDGSASASARRTTMFGDQKHSPTLWATLVRAALLTLGMDYQIVLRRGAPPPPLASPPPQQKAGGPAAPATPLIRKPVFRNTPSSPLHSVVESLAADGAVTQALTHSLDTTVSHLPDLFKSTASSPAPVTAVQKTVATVKAAKPTRLAKLYIPSDLIPEKARTACWAVGQWWSRPRASRLADNVVPNRETDILIAEVLSRLVCMSLTEDRYGVVQRDIPRILEAFLAFLTAVEDARREIAISDDADDTAQAVDIYSRAADAMKEGVARIVQTFGPRLAGFRFPHHIAQKLQAFADY